MSFDQKGWFSLGENQRIFVHEDQRIFAGEDQKGFVREYQGIFA